MLIDECILNNFKDVILCLLSVPVEVQVPGTICTQGEKEFKFFDAPTIIFIILAIPIWIDR